LDGFRYGHVFRCSSASLPRCLPANRFRKALLRTDRGSKPPAKRQQGIQPASPASSGGPSTRRGSVSLTTGRSAAVRSSPGNRRDAVSAIC
jgi:hypothetical protein